MRRAAPQHNCGLRRRLRRRRGRTSWRCYGRRLGCNSLNTIASRSAARQSRRPASLRDATATGIFHLGVFFFNSLLPQEKKRAAVDRAERERRAAAAKLLKDLLEAAYDGEEELLRSLLLSGCARTYGTDCEFSLRLLGETAIRTVFHQAHPWPHRSSTIDVDSTDSNGNSLLSEAAAGGSRCARGHRSLRHHQLSSV